MLKTVSSTIKIYKLTKQVKSFYQQAFFIPTPKTINLYDVNCVAHIADDLAVFGKNYKHLRNKLIELL